MVQLSESDIQCDHARWCDDYAAWLEDVEQWEARHAAAMAELKRLFGFIKALRQAVRGHAETITTYEDVCRRHTQNVSRAGGCSPGNEAMEFAHAQIAANHPHVRGVHEQIRAHHREAVAMLQALIRLIEEEAACPRSRCRHGGGKEGTP